MSVWSSTAVDPSRNRLYIGTGHGYEAPTSPLSDSLLALDIATGVIVWQNQFTANDYFTVPANCPGLRALRRHRIGPVDAEALDHPSPRCVSCR